MKSKKSSASSKKLKSLLLFPFGGNAREALLAIMEINRLKPTWNVIGFLDDARANQGKETLGVKVIGSGGDVAKYPQAMVLAVPGNPSNYFKRQEIISRLGLDEKRLATIIHPACAVAADAHIGCNTLIMAHAVVSCGVSIGKHCVILPQTVISHDSRIGDYCLIGSNVSVSGNVTIQDNCYIGSAASIIDNVGVGRQSLIGLGANVVESVGARTVVAGNPAKKLRDVNLDG